VAVSARHIAVGLPGADDRGKDAGAVATFVVNHAPVVAITGPASFSKSVTGATVTLTASALDAEDGDLGAALRWSSDLDGALGSGATVTTTGLRRGRHAIAATATDADGATTTASIALIVTGPLPVPLETATDGSFPPGTGTRSRSPTPRRALRPSSPQTSSSRAGTRGLTGGSYTRCRTGSSSRRISGAPPCTTLSRPTLHDRTVPRFLTA
jgi:hypothetical protein